MRGRQGARPLQCSATTKWSWNRPEASAARGHA
jgi:hypothetical protein